MGFAAPVALLLLLEGKANVKFRHTILPRCRRHLLFIFIFSEQHFDAESPADRREKLLPIIAQRYVD